ncbi:MAG: DUF3120 domain-containing protein [Synechococcaceae cyanobacterium]|nr:DUF3120 domain-containing protein [Synechococcaceae cyanobacterium]
MIGAPACLTPAPAARPARAWPRLAARGREALPLIAAALTLIPVFLQAPWVRQSPLTASLFTAPLLALALLLERRPQGQGKGCGALLVGFCGSWLGGCLFWGWFRLHPVCHLPLEAFALPLALTGLRGRWHLACCFYLASLAGTAATDGAIALTGLMPLWPQVLQAPATEAGTLLQQAATALLHPLPLILIGLAAWGLLLLSSRLGPHGAGGRLAAATLTSTLAIDAVFLGAALLAPRLSGLI